MDTGDKMEESKKENKPLSFSINMILKDDGKQKTEAQIQALTARVPMATIHHFAPAADRNYIQFESALTLSNRKCSTPETDECPSPDFNTGHNKQESIQSVYPYYPHTVDSNLLNLRNPVKNFQRTPESGEDAEGYQSSPSPLTIKSMESNSINVNIPMNKRQRVLINNDKSLDSLGESYQNSPSPLKAKKKKTRTVFSRNQIYQLENAFEMKRYLSSAERSGLASQLQLSETQIKIWFQNRRNKWKRQISGEMDEIPIPSYALHSPTGLVPSPYCSPCSSVSPYGHMLDSRDALLRGSLAVSNVPAFYSNPLVQETRLRPSFIS